MDLGTVRWTGDQPPIYLTTSYTKYRSGPNMIYQVTISIGAVTGYNYFGYPIIANIYVNNSSVANPTLKNASPSQWGNSISYTTGEITVPATSGTVPLSINLYSALGGNRNQTYNYTMEVEPAGSVLGTINNFTIGNAIDIPITKYNGGFYDVLTVNVGNTTIKTINGLTSGYDVTFNSTELNNIFNTLPNSTTGTFTFTLNTFADGSLNTWIGSSTRTATGTIPASIAPGISGCTLVENTSGMAAQFSLYVQNKSTIKGTVNAIAGYGATISSILVNINGTSYTLTSSTREFITGVIKNSGLNNYSITVTDTRGRTTTVDGATNGIYRYFVAPYEMPKATTLTVKRCTFDGTNYTENDEGTYAKISISGSISQVNDGVENQNFITATLGYRIAGSVGTYTQITVSPESYWIGQTVYASGFSVDNVYEFLLTINDFFNIPATQTTNLATSYTLINFSADGKGIAFGGVYNVNKGGALQIKGSVVINDNVGASGTFTSANGKTVTVNNGIITSIV